MRFSLVGQLRGPECKEVMRQVIVLRRGLEPLFEKIKNEHVSEFDIVLRVDGSLGSFGSAGVDNIELTDGKICCDLVVNDHGWNALGETEIQDIIGKKLVSAIAECLSEFEPEIDLSEIHEYFGHSI